MAYADDLRQKLLHAVDTQQASQARLAAVFGVSLSWVKGVVRRRRETGNVHALPHRGGRRPKLSVAQRDEVQRYLATHDDVLLRELQAWAAWRSSRDMQRIELVPLVNGDELAA
jgi:transposase